MKVRIKIETEGMKIINIEVLIYEKLLRNFLNKIVLAII